MSFDPTLEQAAIRDAFLTGADLVIQAGAGTGKTTTLNLLARSAPRRQGLYLAFNRVIAAEAKSSFPHSVTPMTAHALAFRAVGPEFSARLSKPREPGESRLAANFLGSKDMTFSTVTGNRHLSRVQVARVALDTVGLFCQTDGRTISGEHVPTVAGLDQRRDPNGPNHQRLAEKVLPLARRAWKDLQSRDGILRYSHAYYLKAYQLTDPVLTGDFVMLDEAQDASPVIADIVMRQTHMQRVLVGDASQAIYGWTGAVDSMRGFTESGVDTLSLSQSFRFGPEVARAANRLLSMLDAPLRLEGTPSLSSVLAVLDEPGGQASSAVLCRTNAGALAEVIAGQSRGLAVALAGGADDIRRFVEGARDLQQRGSSYHFELMAFQSWPQVLDYVDSDPGGSDLSVLVNLVEEYGVGSLLAALNRCVPEPQADLVVSTAHKCSPPDEPVLTVEGWKPIGELDPAVDRLAGYARSNNRLTWGARGWTGFTFEKVTRHYEGHLVVIETERSKTRVTPEHRVLAAFAPAFYDRWAVYLMRRGDWWRVGMCRTGSRPYRSGDLGTRMSAEKAQEGWLLSLHDTREAAAAEEARVQAVYGVTGLMFERVRGLLSASAMHAVHAEAAEQNGLRAKHLLDAYGLLVDSPLYRNEPGAMKQGQFLTAAANLVSLTGCVTVPCAPDTFLNREAHRRGGWTPEQHVASVQRVPYSGQVVGLEIPPYHYYVSGNAVVHNSKGREWPQVRLSNDFEPPPAGTDPEVLRNETMLAYVAVTRGRLVLDPGLWASEVGFVVPPLDFEGEVSGPVLAETVYVDVSAGPVDPWAAVPFFEAVASPVVAEDPFGSVFDVPAGLEVAQPEGGAVVFDAELWGRVLAVSVRAGCSPDGLVRALIVGVLDSTGD